MNEGNKFQVTSEKAFTWYLSLLFSVTWYGFWRQRFLCI